MQLQLIDKVLDFMLKFEQPISDVPIVRDTKAKILRYSLIEEERNELVAAYFYKDECQEQYLIETADALIDLLYVLYGIYGDFGLDISTDVTFDVDQHILHTPRYNTNDSKIEHLIFCTLPSLTHRLYSDIFNNNFNGMSRVSIIIEAVILKLLDLHNLPLYDLFYEVHESNMSKLHDGKVVKNDKGKVIKSPNYKPADIRSLLKTHGIV